MGGGARFLGGTGGKVELSLVERRGMAGVKFSYWAGCNLKWFAEIGFGSTYIKFG